MNEISNQSLHQKSVRADVVPSKPALTQKRNDSAANGGNTLPPSVSPSAKSEAQKQKTDSQSKMTEENKENIKAAVAEINKYTQSMQRDLRFNLDDSSGHMVVTVLDRESDEVIRQIPDDVFLKMARNLKQQMEMNVDKRMGESDGTALHLINTKA